jgi:4,5-DOPA dioxygenase extradiol
MSRMSQPSKMTRRDVLVAGALAGLALPASACAAEGEPGGGRAGVSRRQPSVFVGHGSPILAIDPGRGEPFRRWGAGLGRPTALLAVSELWEAAPPAVGSTRTLPLIYDFGGFPAPLYEVAYPAPGAPELARRVAELLGDAPLRSEPDRGLDHGVWTPLVHLYPQADVPVLQLSLPSQLGARGIWELGRRLAPLRDEGVLLLASGNVTHNLRTVQRAGGPTPAWAQDFDDWTAQSLQSRDLDALLDYAARAPALRQNHPTEEHWLPLYFALGAADLASDAVAFPITGFDAATLSKRCVQLG